MRTCLFASVLAGVALAAGLGACSSNGTDDTASGGQDGSGGQAQSGSGLPCEVAPIIEARCLNCHGNPPSSAAPQSLVTIADWKATSPTDAAKTNADVSVARMNDTVSPMPPGGGMSAEDIKVVADWVAAGMPGGDCEANTVDDPILNADPVCTSMDTWPANSDHSFGKSDEDMFPGMPCNDCHQNPGDYGFNEGGPTFKIAGTVYPSGHEPDLCAGIDGSSLTDVKVHIGDATGKTWVLDVNASGNFLIGNGAFTLPYSAKVVSPAGERVMSLKPSNGDCNLCHTQEGSSGENPNDPVAPGRIVVPLGN